MPEVKITGQDSTGNQVEQIIVYSVTTPSLEQMLPVWSRDVYNNYGICQHTNFQTTVYQFQNELIDAIADTGISHFRSMYAHNLAKNTEAINRARARGVKWHATVMTINSTEDEIRTRINHLANNAADLVIRLEGINEPNETNVWADSSVTAVVQRQYWMSYYVRTNSILRPLWLTGKLTIGTPSMHDIRLDNSDGEHWLQYANKTVQAKANDPDFSGAVSGKALSDFVNAHGYQGGGAVDRNRQRRVDYARAAFGNMPIIFSETGYTNAMGPNRTAAHNPVPESISSVYDRQIVFDFFNAKLGAIRYEALDDPDPGEDNVVESNFGMLYEVDENNPAAPPATAWKEKPGVAPLRTILNWLKDSGDSYTPQPVGLKIVSKHADIRYTLVQRRDGATRMYAFRYGTIWDTKTEQPIILAPVNITLEDAQGTRTIAVGPEVKAIDIRR